MKAAIAMTYAVLFCGAAHAQPQPADSTAKVAYGDLDLSRAADRATLERRITTTIDGLCPQPPAPPELGYYRLFHTCRQSARASVKPQLAAIYGRAQLAEASILVSVPAK